MAMKSHRTAATAAALGMIATAIALAAPQAGAEVTYLAVDRDQSFGSAQPPIGTSCTYSVVAKTDPGREVIFLDEVDGEVTHTTFQSAIVTADGSGMVRTKWTPVRKGQHRIVVLEPISEDDFDAYTHDNLLTVGTGVNVGPACVVLP